MNDVMFGYFVRGIAADVNLPVDKLGAAVRHVLGAEATKGGSAPVPPIVTTVPAWMQPLPVPAFCAHNINVAEECAACQRNPGNQRTFVLVLPPTTRLVYTLKSTSP